MAEGIDNVLQADVLGARRLQHLGRSYSHIPHLQLVLTIRSADPQSGNSPRIHKGLVQLAIVVPAGQAFTEAAQVDTPLSPLHPLLELLAKSFSLKAELCMAAALIAVAADEVGVAVGHIAEAHQVNPVRASRRSCPGPRFQHGHDARSPESCHMIHQIVPQYPAGVGQAAGRLARG